MRKKPAKIKTPSTKFKEMGDKQPQNAFLAWKKNYKERIEAQLAFDNSDLDPEFEKKLLDDLEALEAVEANVERRAKDDSDKDVKIAEQDALIAKVQKRNDTLQDRMVGTQKRRNSKSDVMDLVLKLCKKICEDEYPHPLRFRNIIKDERLFKILDENNCKLTIGRGRDEKITRRPKNIKKLIYHVSISKHSVVEMIRRANKGRYPKEALLGAPSRQEECRLQSKPKKRNQNQKWLASRKRIGQAKVRLKLSKHRKMLIMI